MDRKPEELQFLGFFGIYRESYKIIITWRKIFSQITLVLLLPLSFIFLAHIQISEFISSKISANEDALDFVGSPKEEEILHRVSSNWTAYWLVKAAYFIFVVVFSLLSTSAVVYTIACIYTAKDLSFRKVMSVVPKVWKRLMVTFLWTILFLVGYNSVAIMVLVMVLIIYLTGASTVILTILIILLVLYFVGFVYISVVWQQASVVSVLEDARGIAAMKASYALIKGKTKTAAAIFIKIQIATTSISILFARLVVDGESLGLGARVGLGILFFLLLAKLFLLSLVIQTVIYFVCKSYHNQSIDKSCLADHLEGYLGEYVPLNAKTVQLEQHNV